MDKLVLAGFDGEHVDDTFTMEGVKIDNTLSVTGRAADAKKTGDEIGALKEDLSTLNTEGTVPTSEQMLSDNYTEDSVPYHFRRTASDNADREELEIVGGSVAWNQLVSSNSIPSASSTVNGITRTSNGDGSVTLNGTSTASTSIALTGGINAAEGHVYYLGNPNGFKLYDGYGTHGKNIVKLPAGTSTLQIYTNIASGVTLTDYKLYPQAIDLTQALGSTIADYIYSLEQATAGAGVALFRSLFNKDYYPYDAGSMQSVSGLSEHKTVGFNQWDEEWEVGAYALSDGQKSVDNSRIRNKNFIHVFPSTSYCNGCPQIITALFYDSDKNYIGQYGYNSGQVFVTPARAQYMNFYVAQSYGNVYKNDICINLSDPAKNGQYEPYDGHSYALDDSLTLRGIPTLVDGKIKWDGDVYASDGKVTRRYGIVDLGTLDWLYHSDTAHFYLTISSSKTTGSNFLCDKYVYSGAAETSAMSDKSTGLYRYGNIFRIKDTAYIDAATFKTAMSGVYLVYELATPTAETADPYIGIQSCHPNGTEEFVSTGIVPVGHKTKYPDNLRMKLDNLPWNFARLIAPVEDTFKATQNYDMGRRLIINNVLYIATANIANNANIVVGSNVRETNIDELLAELAQ